MFDKIVLRRKTVKMKFFSYSKFAIFELIPCVNIQGEIYDVDERFVCATNCAKEAALVVREEQMKTGKKMIIRTRKFQDASSVLL